MMSTSVGVVAEDEVEDPVDLLMSPERRISVVGSINVHDDMSIPESEDLDGRDHSHVTPENTRGRSSDNRWPLR